MTRRPSRKQQPTPERPDWLAVCRDIGDMRRRIDAEADQRKQERGKDEA